MITQAELEKRAASPEWLAFIPEDGSKITLYGEQYYAQSGHLHHAGTQNCTPIRPDLWIRSIDLRREASSLPSAWDDLSEVRNSLEPEARRLQMRHHYDLFVCD